jgi:hypothetical protein
LLGVSVLIPVQCCWPSTPSYPQQHHDLYHSDEWQGEKAYFGEKWVFVFRFAGSHGASLNVLYERHGFSRATQTATNEGFKGCGKTGFRVGRGFIPGTVQSNLQPLGPEVRF